MNIETIFDEALLDFQRLLRSSGKAKGAWKSLFYGGNIEPSGIRPYRQGDRSRDIIPRSLIRARASGNRDELLTRKFVGRRAMRAWIFVDLTASFMRQGSIDSLHAKPAREGAVLFSALVLAASLFWKIPVGLVGLDNGDVYTHLPQKDLSSFNSFLKQIHISHGGEAPAYDDEFDLLENELLSKNESLIFFLSDFAVHQEKYPRFFDRLRHTNNIDVVPVFVDTSWIWDEIKGTFTIAGTESVLGRPVDIITNKNGLAILKEGANTHRQLLSEGFARLSIPWIRIGNPNLEIFKEEMTNCFMEKQRSR